MIRIALIRPTEQRTVMLKSQLERFYHNLYLSFLGYLFLDSWDVGICFEYRRLHTMPTACAHQHQNISLSCPGHWYQQLPSIPVFFGNNLFVALVTSTRESRFILTPLLWSCNCVLLSQREEISMYIIISSMQLELENAQVLIYKVMLNIQRVAKFT